MITASHLFREIHQQPAALSHLLTYAAEPVQALAQAILKRNISHVVIAARGTSDNAARYAKYVFGAMNGLTVALAAPSLFSLYGTPPRFKDALVLGISQSGKSPDIVAVLAEAKQQNALTAVITNSPDSDLAQQGDIVIDLGAGQELAVAATKTYTTELATVAMISAALKGDVSEGGLPAGEALGQIPEAVSRSLAMIQTIARVTPRYRYMERCVVIGRGFNYATAFEMALKMKELTYTVVQPYSSADFLHGPMALIEQGFPVIVIAPSGALEHKMLEFMASLHRRRAETIAISDVEAILKQSRIPLRLPQSVPEWLSPPDNHSARPALFAPPGLYPWL